MWRLIAAAVLASTGTGAAAQPGEYAKAGSWTITRDIGNCSASAFYASGAELYLQYHAAANEVAVAVFSKSLTMEKGSSHAVRLIFEGGGYGLTTYARRVGMRLDLPTGEAFVTVTDAGFLDEVARRETFAMILSVAQLPAFDLTDGAAAMAKLKECARLEAAANPKPHP